MSALQVQEKKIEEMKNISSIESPPPPPRFTRDVDDGFASRTEPVLLSRLYSYHTHLGASWGRRHVAFLSVMIPVLWCTVLYLTGVNSEPISQEIRWYWKQKPLQLFFCPVVRQRWACALFFVCNRNSATWGKHFCICIITTFKKCCSAIAYLHIRNHNFFFCRKLQKATF